jgi:hypothetical protein
MISEANKSGQSLTEYVLPIALMVLVGVGLLGALGGQLNDIFANTIGSKSNSPVNGQSSTLASLPSASNDSTGIQVIQSGFVPTPNSNTLSFDISENGKTVHVSIPNYPDSLITAVETVGADGTTQSYAATLKTLADKLEEEGVLTPDRAQMIRDIANSGFELSRSQTLVQKALTDVPQNGGKLLFPDTQSNSSSLIPLSLLQVLYLSSPTYYIQQKFDNAKAAGALNHPILQRVVQDAVNNIKNSGNFSSSYLANILNGDSTAQKYTKSDLNNFLITQANIQETTLQEQAQETAGESTKICDVSGKSKVKGLSCQPVQSKEATSTKNALPSPPTSKPAPSRMGNLASDFIFKKP